MVSEVLTRVAKPMTIARKLHRQGWKALQKQTSIPSMFFNFMDELRDAGIGASFKEHLTLLEALDKDVIEQTPEAFYYLSRATFVKDEGLLDRFDQVFHKVFKA